MYKRQGSQGTPETIWLPVSDVVKDILDRLRLLLHPKQPYPFVAWQRYWHLKSRIGHLSRAIRNSPDGNFAGGFNSIMQRANVPKVAKGQPRSFHDLRATFATNALRNGMDLPTVSRLMRHAKVATTAEFYIAPDPEACAKAKSCAMA